MQGGSVMSNKIEKCVCCGAFTRERDYRGVPLCEFRLAEHIAKATKAARQADENEEWEEERPNVLA
jgi:hypothetical protein